MSTKAIVLTVLIVIFLLLVVIDGRRKLKKNNNNDNDYKRLSAIADSLLLFGFNSENFHFIVIPRTYAVNI